MEFTDMNLSCTNCGKQIPPGSPFCASCGHPAPAAPPTHSAPAPSATALAPRTAAAPKSGGIKGIMVTLGALGCLGVIVVGVLALVAVFYIIGNSGKKPVVPPGQNKGPVYTKSVKDLVPQTVGSLKFQRYENLDADTVRMLGATDAAKAIYQPRMNLLVLNYSSIDRASRALEPLRSALYPDKDGWTVAARGPAAEGTRIHATLRQEQAATLWNWGTIIVIMWGGPAQVQEFETGYIK